MAGHIAIVGAGLVGSGWTIVFARAGETVRVYDGDAGIRAGFLQSVRAQLEDLKRYELVEDVEAVIGHVTVCETLGDAVTGARFVQESVFEQTDVKAAISAEIGPLLGDGTVVGSSTSGIPGSAFTENAPNRERFLVTHPINPPYLVPLVEVVPTPWTAPDSVETAMSVMASVGQSPVLVRREVEGFLVNRLQGALLREAWALFEEGYASAEDIDKTVSQGLGLRWFFMGPFETIDLNAPGGVKDYAERLGPLYHAIQASRTDPQPWSEALMDAVDAERRAVLPKDRLAERRAWRDRKLMALAAFRKSDFGKD